MQKGFLIVNEVQLREKTIKAIDFKNDLKKTFLTMKFH